MKIVIVSDIHGNYQNMKKVIENDPSFDYLFLLGDILSGPDIDGYDPKQLAILLNLYQDKIFYVRGNCDQYQMDTLDFFEDNHYLKIPIDHKVFFLTHGHLYSPYEVSNIPFDVFLSGHTHIPKMEKKDEKLFLNPGSITLPKGGSNKSYLVYQDGEFFLKDLEENRIINKIKI